MTHRLIAVIIPFYQREAGILSRALESVAAQVLPGDVKLRVYVIDDASPHPAEVELADWQDRLDIVCDRQVNGGPGSARNTGLDLVRSHGDTSFVAFLDSDDIWSPRHLMDALDALSSGYDFYCCDNTRPGVFDLFSEDVDILKDKGAKLEDRSVILDEIGPVRGFEANTLNDEIVVEYISHTSTIVVRSDLIGDIRFDTDLRNACEDRMFWLMLALSGARIAISWRCNVECGRGVNLFFDAYDWDSPGTIERFGCQLLFAEKLVRHEAVTPASRAFALSRASRSRRAYAFLFIRKLVRFKRPPVRTFLHLIRFDPLLPLRMPGLFLTVFFDRRDGVPQL